MNENSPLISVFLPYYNDKAFLADAVESVLNQSYKNIELVLFNHASADGSRDIAHSYNDQRIIHIDAKKNLGAGATYNISVCLAQMSGVWFKTMCADDILRSDCFENMVAYALENPDKDLIFGNMEYVNAEGKSLKKDWFSDVRGFSVNNSEIDLMKLFSSNINVLPYTGAFVKTEKLRSLKMDNSLTIRADMWLWLSSLLQGAKVGYCNQIIGSYRFHGYQENSFDPEIIHWRSEYEKSPFLSLFFGINDISIAKTVFPDSPYADRLTDPQDIPFYVAEYFLRKDGYPFAYDALFKMMTDDDTCERLERVFGFGVLELRKLYAFKKETSFKKRLYVKKPKELTLLELLYLTTRKISRKIGFLLTLRFLRKKK